MNKPLCVDCDGTLIKTDLLHEAILSFLKHKPWMIFSMVFWLFHGKAFFKNQLAKFAVFDYGKLPYNEEVIRRIEQAHKSGSAVYLVTASPQVWADGISAHLKCFDEAIGTTDKNLSANHKSEYLVSRFGEKEFDYIGNTWADVPVWKSSGKAILVTHDKKLIKLTKSFVDSEVITTEKSTVLTYLKALRVYQWVKNILVLLPMAAAHQLSSIAYFQSSLIAFVAFSLCASSVYLLNDLLDLEADRAHVRKRRRPFASGRIPVIHGFFLTPLLLLLSFYLAIQLGSMFMLVLVSYFILTLAYSFKLKQQVIVDVILLGTLYTIRIVAGSAATGIVTSFWLLGFSMFVFLSLALIKRYSELLVTLKEQKNKTPGRGYLTEDLPVLMSLGSSAGIASVMVLALYVNSPESTALYEHKLFLWLLPPLFLYWISRVWMKAHRGEVDDDPIVFALKDWQSIVIALFLIVILVFAK